MGAPRNIERAQPDCLGFIEIMKLHQTPKKGVHSSIGQMRPCLCPEMTEGHTTARHRFDEAIVYVSGRFQRTGPDALRS